MGKYIKIEFSADKQEYFENFNKILKQTDILWTKPSELTFYTALGLPIIMSDPVGSQEKFNRRWLKTIGSGIDQENVRYTKQWLFDWLNSGWFAEAALEGYLEASTSGLDNIHKIIGHKPEKTIKIKQFSQY